MFPAERLARVFAVLNARIFFHKGRILLSVAAIALGVALGFAVHLINRAAVNELAAGVRTLVTSLALVLALTPELMNRPMNLGYGFLWSQYPVGACDWIEKHDVRGRGATLFGRAACGSAQAAPAGLRD